MGRALPWILASGGALATYLWIRHERRSSFKERDLVDREAPEPSGALEPRNAGLIYRPVGSTGERYPDWIRALVGKSGVYVIREIQRDGSSEIVYVGESHTGRLYDTLTRHFQQWRRHKRFWRGQYGGTGHDPGLTYPRDRVTVAARVLPAARAINEEARLIARLRPRDNLLGQAGGADEEVIPF